MAISKEQEHTCADCGVTITGGPVVPGAGESPTQAQIQKLKPTVFLCAECAEERGILSKAVAIGKTATQTPPPAL